MNKELRILIVLYLKISAEAEVIMFQALKTLEDQVDVAKLELDATTDAKDLSM